MLHNLRNINVVPGLAAQILLFPSSRSPTATPVAHFLRVGEAHRKLGELHAAGHLPARRVVFDASRFRQQRELVGGLRDAGAQIVLDSEAAELASVAKCGGHARRAPWAPEGGGILGPANFHGSALDRFVAQVASYAMEHRVHALLSPSHFLRDTACPDWFAVDRNTCLMLRRALDREGGANIARESLTVSPSASALTPGNGIRSRGRTTRNAASEGRPA